MSTIVEFRSGDDRKADQMIDAMCALVDGHSTTTGINACLQTLAILIVGYGEQYGGTAQIAERAGIMLNDMVRGLASETGAPS